MNSRDRIRMLLSYREADRVGLADSYWDDTLPRWRREGLPANVEPAQLFGFDFSHLYIDTSLRLPEELLEESDEYTVHRDKHGFTAKMWKGRSGALGYLDHVIKDRTDWARLRRNLAPDYGQGCRVSATSYFTPFQSWPEWDGARLQYDALRERGSYILLVTYGPLEGTWRRRGFAQTLMDMASDRSWLVEMFEAQVALILNVLEQARLAGIVPDGLFLVEDMGYRSGPYFSPGAYRELLWPGHRQIGDYLHAHGIEFFLHTDGDIRTLIPDFLTAGVRVLQPLEAKVGIDVRVLKREYGRDLSFMGNIDVRRMNASPADLEAEVREKLLIARQGGGYIYHSDHSVPPDVSWQQYCLVMDLVRRYGTYAS